MDLAPEQGLDEAALARDSHGLVHIVADAGVALEVGVDIGARLAALDAEIARQAEGGDAVDDAEIDRLGAPAHERVHVGDRHAKHLRGGHGVNVLTLGEGLLQGLDAGDVGDDAQFDL